MLCRRLAVPEAGPVREHGAAEVIQRDREEIACITPIRFSNAGCTYSPLSGRLSQDPLAKAERESVPSNLFLITATKGQIARYVLASRAPPMGAIGLAITAPEHTSRAQDYAISASSSIAASTKPTAGLRQLNVHGNVIAPNGEG